MCRPTCRAVVGAIKPRSGRLYSAVGSIAAMAWSVQTSCSPRKPWRGGQNACPHKRPYPPSPNCDTIAAMLKQLIHWLVVIAVVLQILSLVFGGGATFPDAH